MKQRDTLKETFDLFFGPSEDTAGTGYVTRDVGGTLQQVLIDPAEAAAFEAKCATETAARLEHESKMDDLMQALNQ